MSFVKYQNTNNASSLLIADITASQTTILITDGDQGLFPSSFPFLLTIEHLDASENVILREIVKVVSSNQNSFTVERSAGICVQDDTATNRVQDNTAHAFYSGDKVSLYWTAEQVADIQNNLELKANQDSIANVYDNTATYSVGDIVVFQGDRYVCSTAVSTPEEFDSTKWTKVNVQYDMDQQDSRIDNIETQIAGLGAPNKVDVLVLGGGGGGGGGVCSGPFAYGGGGGAGELKIVDGLVIRRNSITITVGAGGQGGAPGYQTSCAGANGCPSRFGLITAMGGGGGGGGMCGNFNQCYVQGKDGANGGGQGGPRYYTGDLGCYGRPMTETGHFGAGNGISNNTWIAGGGGGGIGGNGGFIGFARNCCCNALFFGGTGKITCFGGTVRCLGGGGGGGSCWSAYNMYAYFDQMQSIIQKLCFTCFGGGLGGSCGANNGGNGMANTGGGGGGAGAGTNTGGTGGNGGSGLVIVRYPTDCSYGIKTATGGTITTATIDGIEYKVHTFTNSGTFEITETA